MSYADTIYTALTGDAGVAAVVGDRVYPHHIPKDAALPAISIQLIGSVPANHLGNTPTLDERRIQIKYVSRDFDEAADLAETARDALEPLGQCGFEIDLPYEFDTEAYSVTQDWVIFFTRS